MHVTGVHKWGFSPNPSPNPNPRQIPLPSEKRKSSTSAPESTQVFSGLKTNYGCAIVCTQQLIASRFLSPHLQGSIPSPPCVHECSTTPPLPHTQSTYNDHLKKDTVHFQNSKGSPVCPFIVMKNPSTKGFSFGKRSTQEALTHP